MNIEKGLGFKESNLSKTILTLTVRPINPETMLILMDNCVYNEIYSIRTDKDLLENEKNSKLYELYEEKIASYEETNSEESLLNAGVFLLNSAVKLDEGSIELKKIRLKKIIELTQHEFEEDKVIAAALLRAKALLEETVILIEKDHNFYKAFLNLEKIREIDDNHNILRGQLWDRFAVNALEIYRLQGETEKHEALVLKVEKRVESIDPHIRWDIIFQLIKSKKFTEKYLVNLSKLRYKYFHEWLSEELESDQKNLIKNTNQRSKKYLLGERLSVMALDPKRNNCDFFILKKAYEKEYKDDSHGAEFLAKINIDQGFTDKNQALVKNGIKQYNELEIAFHVAESKIKYDLAFTDFNKKEVTWTEEKKNLFESIDTIEISIGDPIEIFKNILVVKNESEQVSEKVLQCISMEGEQGSDSLEDTPKDRKAAKEEVSIEKFLGKLEETKQSAYIRNLAELILLIYGKNEKGLLDIFKQVTVEREEFYKKRKEKEFLSIRKEKTNLTIKEILEKNYDIEIIHFYESVLENINKSDDLFVNFALKISQYEGDDEYIPYEEEVDEAVVVLRGFSTKNGIFILRQKDKYLKSHVIKFIKGELAGEEIDMNKITASRYSSD